MNTVASRTPNVKAYYAYWGDLVGIAERVNGSGYLFRPEGERTATLVGYKDPELCLLGQAELSEMQHDVDLAVGGYAAVACGREEGVS